MRRKGGRVIADGATTGAIGNANPPAADGSAFPAVAIPTLDIFARFQGRRDDFEANWLMLEEDAMDANRAPPISADVADKLRRHQQLLSTRQAAGTKPTAASVASGNSTSITTTTYAAASRGSASAGARSEGLSVGNASKPTVKGGADFDSAAAAEAARTKEAVEEKARRAPPATRATDDDEDEDEPYVPEGTDAPQYRKPTTQTARATANSTSAAADTLAAKTGGGSKAEHAEEEGVQGDFLTFLPRNNVATGENPNADANDLQVTVSVSHLAATPWHGENAGDAGGRSSHPSASDKKTSTSSPTSPTPGSARGGAGGSISNSTPQELVVPLWSEARVRRFGGYYPSNRLVALHQEIMDLISFLRPTQAEISIRRHVELEVRRLARKLWPRARLIVYGSLYTHLLLPLSDVDMTLVDLPEGVDAEEALTELANAISREGLCQSAYPQVILKTRVPLVKFQHKGSLVDIDISVNAPDGKNNSDIVITLLNFYPEARPLILLVKYFLQQRDMHEPYRGGLGSYATTLLVISFLQSHPIYTTRHAERPFTGVGKLLVDFFRYCGQYWNFNCCGVSLTGGGHYFRRDGSSASAFAPSSPTSPRSPLNPPQVLIEDPLNAANNAASSLRNWHMISSVCANAYQALTAPFPTAFEACAGTTAAGSKGNHSASSTTVGSASATLPKSLSDYSPDALEVVRRPTLLSRILHVDADTVYRRQSIATAYAALVEADPEAMAAVEAYRAEEDAPLLTGVHAMRRVGGAGDMTARSPVTRAEADGIAALTAAAWKGIGSGGTRKRSRRDDSSSSTSSSSSHDGSGPSSYSDSLQEPARRGTRPTKKTAAQQKQRDQEPQHGTGRDAAESSSGRSDAESTVRSNASSVRLDVTKSAKRRTVR